MKLEEKNIYEIEKMYGERENVCEEYLNNSRERIWRNM